EAEKGVETIPAIEGLATQPFEERLAFALVAVALLHEEGGERRLHWLADRAQDESCPTFLGVLPQHSEQRRACAVDAGHPLELESHFATFRAIEDRTEPFACVD